MTRRRFLKLSALGVGSSVLAACVGEVDLQSVKLVKVPEFEVEPYSGDGPIEVAKDQVKVLVSRVNGGVDCYLAVYSPPKEGSVEYMAGQSAVTTYGDKDAFLYTFPLQESDSLNPETVVTAVKEMILEKEGEKCNFEVTVFGRDT